MQWCRMTNEAAKKFLIIGTKSCRCTLATNASERYGSGDGSSGWKWDKNGIGMGGKESGLATEIKPDVGKGKTYQAPEYFSYESYDFYDLEVDLAKHRLPQPSSGLPLQICSSIQLK